MEKSDQNTVREKLTLSRHEELLRASWEAIDNRIRTDGYFPESIHGAYGGMYPRTIGALASLLLELDQPKRAQTTVAYCFDAIAENDMHRVPHVIGPRQNRRHPIPGQSALCCVDIRNPFVQLYGPGHRLGQEFTAGKAPLMAAELCGYALTDGLEMEVEVQTAEGETVLKEVLPVINPEGALWGRLEWEKPLTLKAGEIYRIYFHVVSPGNTAVALSAYRPEETDFGPAIRVLPEGEHRLEGEVAAVVLDTGQPSYEEGESFVRIMSKFDQVDGQAHLVMAWALSAKEEPEGDFAKTYWPHAAELMDATVDEPYLMRSTTWRKDPGLVLNMNLEHSRDNQFWIAYDFLTQSFVFSALEKMSPFAERYGDSKRLALWRQVERELKGNLEKEMTREFEGKTIYAEMLLPTGKAPRMFSGMGWLNLAPIPAQWDGVDPEIFKNTIDAWHRHAEVDWDGPRIYSNDWLPPGEEDIWGNNVSYQVISKVLGWDILYCHRAGEYDQLADILDFIAQENESEVYAEAFGYNRDRKAWHYGDPGNGEQSCWLSWAMVVLRKDLGLPALPE